MDELYFIIATIIFVIIMLILFNYVLTDKVWIHYINLLRKKENGEILSIDEELELKKLANKRLHRD